MEPIDQAQPQELRREDAEHMFHPGMHPSAQERDGVVFVRRGRDTRVWDVDGRAYIDATGTLWLSNIGHGRAELAEVAAAQIREIEFFHAFHGFGTEPPVRLAAKLAELTPGDLQHVWFTLGGSESNEVALKLARAYFASLGQPERTYIISRRQAYHGFTYAAASASGLDQNRTGFGALLPDFHHIAAPYRYRCELCQGKPQCDLACANELEEAILRIGPERVAAFMAEPVVGVGGIIVPEEGYYRRIREICDKYGALFIDDEVITGFGRTGRWFGIEHWGVVPDIMSMAKGITSGYFPLGATIANARVFDALKGNPSFRMGGFTYAGHPVGCAIALKNIEIIEREGLVAAAAEQGRYLRSRLENLRDLPWVGEIRALGLMAGVEVVADRASRRPFPAEARVGDAIVRRALQHGVILRAVHGNVISLSPPLTVDRPTLDAIVDAVAAAVEGAAAEAASSAGPA